MFSMIRSQYTQIEQRHGIQKKTDDNNNVKKKENNTTSSDDGTYVKS